MFTTHSPDSVFTVLVNTIYVRQWRATVHAEFHTTKTFGIPSEVLLFLAASGVRQQLQFGSSIRVRRAMVSRCSGEPKYQDIDTLNSANNSHLQGQHVKYSGSSKRNQ